MILVNPTNKTNALPNSVFFFFFFSKKNRCFIGPVVKIAKYSKAMPYKLPTHFFCNVYTLDARDHAETASVEN